MNKEKRNNALLTGLLAASVAFDLLAIRAMIQRERIINDEIERDSELAYLREMMRTEITVTDGACPILGPMSLEQLHLIVKYAHANDLHIVFNAGSIMKVE